MESQKQQSRLVVEKWLAELGEEAKKQSESLLDPKEQEREGVVKERRLLLEKWLDEFESKAEMQKTQTAEVFFEGKHYTFSFDDNDQWLWDDEEEEFAFGGDLEDYLRIDQAMEETDRNRGMDGLKCSAGFEDCVRCYTKRNIKD